MDSERRIYDWVLKTTRRILGERVKHLWIYPHQNVGLDERLEEFPLPPPPPGGDQGLPGRVARTGVPIVCHDVERDEFFRTSYLPIFPESRAQWCFPLLAEGCSAREDSCPVLCLDSREGIDPALRLPLDLLSLLGGLEVAVLRGLQKLARASTLRDLERWRNEQQIQDLSGIRPEALVRKLLEALGGFLQAQGLTFWQVDKEGEGFCHPIFSPRTPPSHRAYPPPGMWGPVGKVVASSKPRFSSKVRATRALAASRFMTEQDIRATAYVPGRVSEPSGQSPSSKVKGILFANFDRERVLSPFEKELLTTAADAAAGILQLRSLARRHRLAERFDVRPGTEYPSSSASSRRTAQAILAALASRFDCPHGVLYVRDRPGSLFIRYEATSELGPKFKGRYRESHPFPLLMAQCQKKPRILSGSELIELAGGPRELQESHVLAVPLCQGETLLGYGLLAREEPFKVEGNRAAADLSFYQQALEALLALDHQASSQHRHISLLGQFLRIYEYAANETSPVPLLTAFLDVLLEGSTADAAYIFLEGRVGPEQRLHIARGDVLPLTSAMPESFKEALETGEPRFEQVPKETAAGHSDVRAQAVLPLRFHESRFGALSVEYHAEHPFTEEDRWFFRLLVHQLGQSLHYFKGNQALLEQVRSLAMSGTRIAKLGAPDFEDEVPVAEESRQLALQAKQFTRADHVQLFVRQGDDFVLQAEEGGSGKNTVGTTIWRPDASGLMTRAFSIKSPVNISDAGSGLGRQWKFIVDEDFPDAQSELVVPVIADGQVVGLINLNARRPAAFNESDSRFVEAIAAQAVVLRRAAELQRARRRLREEREILVRINSIAQEAVEQGELRVLQRILDALASYTKAPFLSIHLLAMDGYSFDPTRSLAIPEDPEYLRGLDLENSVLGFAVQEIRRSGGTFHLIEDVRHTPPGWPTPRRRRGQEEERMAKLVVLLGGTDNPVGAINVEHSEAAALKDQLGLVAAVAVGVHNALSLANIANSRMGQDIRQRIAQETDELVQLLTSTVFHDAPQLVKGLKLRLEELKKIYHGDSSRPLQGSSALTWSQIRLTLDRLDRLSTTLPSNARPDRIDVTAIVHQAFDVSALPALPYFEEIRCTIRLPEPGTPFYIEESPNWLRHILENLAVNAFRAMHESRTPDPTLAVSVNASSDGGRVVIQIDDNGPGLPPEILQKIGRERIPHEDRPEQLGIFHQFARKHIQRRGGELLPGESRLGGCLFELRYPVFTA